MKIDVSRLRSSNILIIDRNPINNVKVYEIRKGNTGETEIVVTVSVPEKEFLEFVSG